MKKILHVLSIILIAASVSYAVDFRVTPIRVDVNAENKSGVINVVNEGVDKLRVQMNAVEWTQDEEGKDIYTDTQDIIFFPKIMDVDKDEKRVVRTGIKTPAGKTEKTYRLYIKEIPEPIKKGESKTRTAAVGIALGFGIPIFSKPIGEDPKGVIDKIDLSKSVLKVLVKNTGNVHFMITSIYVSAKNEKEDEVFTKEINGWYLLNGASRLHSIEIPQEVCILLKKLDVEVRTSLFTLSGSLESGKEMCQP